jgi:CBS domain-containing protein
MKVGDVMSRDVRSCAPDDDLGRAAAQMWEADCGILPVVRGRRVVGVVTDRDICMGLTMKGCRPADRTVAEVMSREVYSCVSNDEVGDALETMAERRVRRLPVIDGETLVGIVSMNDIVTHCERHGRPSAREVVAALKSICAPRRVLAASDAGSAAGQRSTAA